MEAFALLFDDILWHYSTALVDIFRIWRNFLWFVGHFFSIPVLLKTFFAPWKRMSEQYRSGFHPQEYIQSMLINMLMRMVGIVARTFVIIAGLISMAAVFFAGIAFFLFWLILPVAMCYCLFLSGKLFISLI